MARFCPVTGDPVLYPDCQECEWKRQCPSGIPGRTAGKTRYQKQHSRWQISK